jgi:large subunit ribosomal protein L15
MLELSNLQPAPGVRKNRKRVGRGRGSGTGKTCGRGQKGQKSRSGGKPHPWFEGGQMPLQRRLPKRGFTNIFRKEYEIVNLNRLSGLAGGDPITPQLMKEKGLIKKPGAVKILGEGEIGEALTIHAHKFSKSAVDKIEKSGGKAVIV